MTYQATANYVLNLLNQNTEWEKRYKGYSKKIDNNQDYYRKVCSVFRAFFPLAKYLNINVVKGGEKTVNIDLRILGTSVAKIVCTPDPNVIANIKNNTSAKGYLTYSKIIQSCANVTFSLNGLKKLNEKLSDDQQSKPLSQQYIKKLCNGSWKWNSSEMKKFRSTMRSLVKKNNLYIKDERTVETLLLSELSKKTKSMGKYLTYIQPCKICGQFYQFPTPLSACDAKNDIINYSKEKGGGIDILARCKKGTQSTICVIELKDEYKNDECPAKAIKQAIAYAVFVLKLIRSKKADGEWWYKKMLGINKKLTGAPITINAVIAMPYPKDPNTALTPEYDTDFANKVVKVGNDEIHLHYIYFKKDALTKPNVKDGFIASFI